MTHAKKLFALCLSLVAVCSSVQAIPVSAATQTYHLTGNATSGRYLKQITTNVTAKVTPITATQTLHKKGYTTKIGVSSTKATSVSATAGLTTGVNAGFASLSASMGVAYTVSQSTGTSISYTIPKTTASGKYRIEHVFPGVHVKQQQIRYDNKGNTIEQQRTISYAPKKSSSYRRLTRYANA